MPSSTSAKHVCSDVVISKVTRSRKWELGWHCDPYSGTEYLLFAQEATQLSHSRGASFLTNKASSFTLTYDDFICLALGGNEQEHRGGYEKSTKQTLTSVVGGRISLDDESHLSTVIVLCGACVVQCDSDTAIFYHQQLVLVRVLRNHELLR